MKVARPPLAVRVGRELTAYGTIAAGVALASLGIGSFLLPAHFIDGGCMGVSMLLASLLDLPLPLLFVVVNAPFVVVGYRHLGGRFALRSTVAQPVVSVSQGASSRRCAPGRPRCSTRACTPEKSKWSGVSASATPGAKKCVRRPLASALKQSVKAVAPGVTTASRVRSI